MWGFFFEVALSVDFFDDFFVFVFDFLDFFFEVFELFVEEDDLLGAVFVFGGFGDIHEAGLVVVAGGRVDFGLG